MDYRTVFTLERLWIIFGASLFASFFNHERDVWQQGQAPWA